jgi:hypothetical protein
MLQCLSAHADPGRIDRSSCVMPASLQATIWSLSRSRHGPRPPQRIGLEGRLGISRNVARRAVTLPYVPQRLRHDQIIHPTRCYMNVVAHHA